MQLEDDEGCSFNTGFLNAIMYLLHTHTHTLKLKSSDTTALFTFAKTCSVLEQFQYIYSSDSNWLVICTKYCSKFGEYSTQITFLF